MTLPINEILCGDCLEVMKDWPDGCVDCCITSPPYWGLRNYGVVGQLGLEKTPTEYVAKIVDVFMEVKRLLKAQGVLWLNLGDTYLSAKSDYMPTQTIAKGNTRSYIQKNSGLGYPPNRIKQKGLKQKDLVGIPWRAAFALQADGWYLRQDIIWAKPNPIPESVKDRCTKSHEYIFLLSKSKKYYFDNEAIKEDSIDEESYTGRRFRSADKRRTGLVEQHFDSAIHKKYEKRNRRSVWTINVICNKDAHFARFPDDLVEPMILAGCPVGGIVLDPFCGTATTCKVAGQLNRDYVGIDIKKEYVEQFAAPTIKAVETGVPVREQEIGQLGLF